MSHELTWIAPQPFWKGAGSAAPLAQPQILRFTSDQFMDELLATLEHDPAALTGYAVMEETWRGPGPSPAPDPQRWLQREPRRLLGLRRKALLRQRALAEAAAGPVSPAEPEPAAATSLKLYQPAHMRHYLVAGSLVCQTVGLPDRQIDPARHKTSFVLRRLLPKKAAGSRDDLLPDPAKTALWDEYAFLPQGKAGIWRKVGAADDDGAVAVVLPGEERLPLFPALYRQDDEHRRRLFIGSVPVGRREAYQGAPADQGNAGASAASKPIDPRLVLFQTQVLGPWKALVNRVMRHGDVNKSPDDADALKNARPEWVFARKGNDSYEKNAPDPDALRAARSAVQTSSWYLLLDLHLFLQAHLKTQFLDVIAAGGTPTGAAGALYGALHGAALPAVLTGAGAALTALGGTGSLVENNGAYGALQVELNLIAALKRIVKFGPALEGAGTPFEIPRPGAGAPSGWPDFLFLFADPWFGVLQPPSPPGFAPPAGDYLAEKIQARIDALADLVRDALPELPAGKPLPEPTLASMQPEDMRDAWYVMRLVFERPDCAPFRATVASAPTRPFRMAGFFDPDAPARPIRIGLPVDISPAGLRKFDKNAVFVLSDMMCGQIDRMKGLGLGDLVRSVLPWPFHKDLDVPDKGACKTGDGLSLGMMCSLSIPIITICALILLMIIVSLLDFVFRWLPYFVVCFPLPGFKGKKD